MRTVIVATLISAGLLGCHIGPSAKSYPVANSGRGSSMNLTVGRARMDGELLAVRDSSLLVLHSEEVLLVPFRAITDASFDGSFVRLTRGRAPTHDEAEMLRLISRFPQGVSSELEQRLLAAYGQKALVVAGP